MKKTYIYIFTGNGFLSSGLWFEQANECELFWTEMRAINVLFGVAITIWQTIKYLNCLKWIHSGNQPTKNDNGEAEGHQR